MKKGILILLVFLMVSKNIIAQQFIDSVKLEMIPYIEKKLKKYKVKGMSIAIVDNQEIIWAQGFGFSNEAIGLPATEQTVYRIASISKLFVSTAIMQLHEQGKLHIDSSLVKYLPDFSVRSDYGDIKDITLRALLTHHSGLPGDILKGMFADKVLPPESILADLKDMNTAYPPNHIFAYSNIGFSLLGLVIERQSGISLEEYMKNNIYSPLKMTHSSFEMPAYIEEFYSKGYINKTEFDEPPIRDKAAGLMVSNVLDLSQFIKAMLAFEGDADKVLFSKEIYNEITSVQNEDVIRDIDFKIGLTWWLNTPKEIEFAGKMISHGGDTEAFHSQLSILSEKKLGVVVLTNTDKGANIRKDISEKLLQSVLKYKYKAIFDENEPKEKQKAISTHAYADYLGDYASPVGLLSISSKNKYLRTKIQGFKVNFYPKKDSSFLTKIKLGFIKIPLKDEAFNFTALDNDTVILLNDRILALKTKQIVIDTTWNQYMGEYITHEIGTNRFHPTDVELIKEKGFLILKIKIAGGKIEYVLEPLKNGEAKIIGLGRNMNEHIYFRNENSDIFMFYSGYKLQLNSGL